MEPTTNKLESLRRLIEHPATPEHEREAARLAIKRILHIDKAKLNFAAIFSKNAKRTIKG